MRKALYILTPIVLICLGHINARSQNAYIDSLVKVLKTTVREDTTRANLLYTIAETYSTIDPEQGLVYSKQGLELSEKIGYRKGVYSFHKVSGYNYENRSEYDKAISSFEAALKVANELGEKKYIAGSTREIGTVYYYQSNYTRALDYYYKAMKLFEELGNKKGMAGTALGLGSIYSAQRIFNKALEYDFKALKMYEELGDKQGIGNISGNIGHTYSQMNEYEKAIPYILKDIQTEEELGNKSGLSVALLMAANGFYVAKNYPEAIKYAERNITVSRELGYKRGEGEAYALLGFIYRNIAHDSVKLTAPIKGISQKDKPALLKQAAIYFEQGLAMGKETNISGILQQCYEGLSTVYYSQGNYKKAYDCLDMFSRIKDTVFSEENKLKVAGIEAQRDIDLKDRDITIKNKQIELDKLAVIKKRNERGVFIGGIVLLLLSVVIFIRQQRAKTKRQEEAQKAQFGRQLLEIELKALRAQMNPHFIFNCLNSIQAFILKEHRTEATDYLQKFSRLIRLILDNSQKTSNTIEDEAEILGLYLDLERLRLKNRFDYEIKVTGEVDATFTEIPSMVIQPLVENSIWHGLMPAKEQGVLKIEFKKEENQLKCIVEDNGIGRERSKNMKGESAMNHTSKGMKLIEDRLKAWSQTKGLNYIFAIFDSTEHNSGTRTEITILYPAYA